MAIRFVDKPDERPRNPVKASEAAAETKAPRSRASVPTRAELDSTDVAPRQDAPAPKSEAQAEGEARFATPIEAAAPVNPDASGELPFADLPRAEKAARKKRAPKPKTQSGPEEPSLT